MSGRFEDIYGRGGDSATLNPRKNDVLAEICRAIIAAPSARDVVQDAATRLQRYFGTASIGIYFISGDQIDLLAMSWPDDLEARFAPVIRERWGRIPASSGLPPALAIRLARPLRWTPQAPELEAEVRQILAELGAGLLLAIPALVDGHAVGCAMVAVPRHATLGSGDEALLADALAMLAIFYHRAQLSEREREHERGALQAHHLARIGELAADVAHEVNNPLSAITHLAEVLLEEEKLSEEARRTVTAIQGEAGRAAHTIQRLQSFVRSGRATDGSVDLRELVREVAGLVGRSREATDVEVEIRLAPDPLPVKGQWGALAGVVQNLLTNAWEATEQMPEPRHVTLHARPADGAVDLLIDDTGPGFSDAVRVSALDPFFTTRVPRPGRGLGLCLASAVVHELGGQILLENWGRPAVKGGGPGEGGARVLLRLPSSGALGEAIPARLDTGDDAAPGAHLHVLVVEDEAAVALPLVKYLRRRGHRVTDVRSAEDALELLGRDAPPDAIVSDFRMPGMGGQGLYRALRVDHPGLVDRLVFVSGDVASPGTEGFLRATGRPYLAKPYPLKELEKLLAEVTHVASA